jgi:two-component system alkaline phosphatase synthesis response regulator PhoP
MDSGKDRALIVEDSSTIAAILKHFLQLEGFEVFVASDGVAGLDAARRERPDLIVTDLNLPGMDGLAMVRALRADDRTQDASIFMLTSDASPESERLARAVGADEYLVKPVPPRHLAARARAVMNDVERAARG